MDTLDMGACLETCRVALAERLERGEDKPWNNHPAFTGVRLKHLVTGKDTAGGMSCHLVDVAPGCALGLHTHETQWEQHQVLSGSGEANLGAGSVAYAPGVLAVIPRGQRHEVQAGSQGLRLLATFFPALL